MRLGLFVGLSLHMRVASACLQHFTCAFAPNDDGDCSERTEASEAASKCVYAQQGERGSAEGGNRQIG